MKAALLYIVRKLRQIISFKFEIKYRPVCQHLSTTAIMSGARHTRDSTGVDRTLRDTRYLARRKLLKLILGELLYCNWGC